MNPPIIFMNQMKKNKLLLAGGCSFTDSKNKFLSGKNIDFPAWPEILSNKLGYEFINTGKRGASNQRIYMNVMNEIIKKKPDLLCVLWTSFDRFMIHNDNFCPIYNLYQNSNNSSETYNKVILDSIEKDNGSSVDQNLVWIYSLQEYCKSNDIDYVFYQGVFAYDPIANKDLYDRKICKNKKLKNVYSYYSDILESDYFSEIDKNFFIDYPFHSFLGGSCFFEKYMTENESKYRISKEDSHPNKLGHELIANIFYNHV